MNELEPKKNSLEIDPYTLGKNWTVLIFKLPLKLIWDELMLLLLSFEGDCCPHYTIRGRDGTHIIVSFRYFHVGFPETAPNYIESIIQNIIKQYLFKDAPIKYHAWIGDKSSDPKRTHDNCKQLFKISQFSVVVPKFYQGDVAEAVHLMVNMMGFKEYIKKIKRKWYLPKKKYPGYKDLLSLREVGYDHND